MLASDFPLVQRAAEVAARYRQSGPGRRIRLRRNTANDDRGANDIRGDYGLLADDYEEDCRG